MARNLTLPRCTRIRRSVRTRAWVGTPPTRTSRRARRWNDSNFFLPKDQRGRLAAVYATGPNGKITRAANDAKGQGHYVDGPRKNFAGGAGLLSTANDYARFMEALRNGGALGDARILSPRSVALMTT